MNDSDIIDVAVQVFPDATVVYVHEVDHHELEKVLQRAVSRWRDRNEGNYTEAQRQLLRFGVCWVTMTREQYNSIPATSTSHELTKEQL